LETQAGADLLALCQTVTEDGSISDREVEDLREWLQRNRGSDFPSIGFLSATVEEILADGKIDPWERTKLHMAVERVLPKAAREKAEEARGKVEAEELLNNPYAYFNAWRVGNILDFMVAGTRYDGRPGIIRRHANEAALVFFMRDPACQFGTTATEIRLSNGLMIGYVPGELAGDISRHLDAGGKYHAWIKLVLTEGRSPIPVIQGELLQADAPTPVALKAGHIPATGIGFTTLALLRAIASVEDLDAKGVVLQLSCIPKMLQGDLLSLSGRTVQIPDADAFVDACRDLVPCLRSVMARNREVGRALEPLLAGVQKATRSVMAQMRPQLECLREDDAAGAERLFAKMEQFTR
jgi:hypothetical protein